MTQAGMFVSRWCAGRTPRHARRACSPDSFLLNLSGSLRQIPDITGQSARLELGGIICFVAASFRAAKNPPRKKYLATGSECHFFGQAWLKHTFARAGGFCQRTFESF